MKHIAEYVAPPWFLKEDDKVVFAGDKYKCPICGYKLAKSEGGTLTKEGVSLYCFNKSCSAQEVAAHARNESSAFEIIKQKYKN